MAKESLQTEDRWLRIRQVLEIVPVSKATWWLWVAEGKAPKPVKLGPKTTCWKLREVQQWLDSFVKEAA